MMLWERKNEAIAVESLERNWHRDQSNVFQKAGKEVASVFAWLSFASPTREAVPVDASGPPKRSPLRRNSPSRLLMQEPATF